MPAITRLLQNTLDLLFPPHCMHCHTDGSVLCATCIAAIQWIQSPRCQRCGIALLSTGGYCQHCADNPPVLHGIRAVGYYQEPLRTYIHALKYSGEKRLAEPLGALLAQAYRAYRMNVDIILPVPLHKTRQQQRGYNQSLLLAEICAQKLQIPLHNDLIVRVSDTAAQVQLTKQERQRNVLHAFRCTASAASRINTKGKILLIDDVCTTGSTLAACALPLYNAGAREVWGLALARPPETKNRAHVL